MNAGDKFHRYTVLGIFRKIGESRDYAHVQCDCGSQARYVRASYIYNGRARCCGCIRKESMTTHGGSTHPLFGVWSSMIDRCGNKNTECFPRYGGRGIQVCEHWKNPHNFYADMAPTHKDGTTLDRIDNSKGYSKDNCRWATAKTQNRNYSRNRVIEHDGKKLCLVEWSELLGIHRFTIKWRLDNGWSVYDALTTQPLKRKISQ